jgi:peptide-methionine (S)-S-oxide reductase
VFKVQVNAVIFSFLKWHVKKHLVNLRISDPKMHLYSRSKTISLLTVIALIQTSAFFCGRNNFVRHTSSVQLSKSKIEMISSKLKDYVKVDLSITKDGSIVETPFDQGICSFVIGGGRFFPQLNSIAETAAVGETVKFVSSVADFDPQLTANIPRENAPGGLRIGDIVKMSNGMSVRVSDITDEFISIDGNPPLAGQDLNFEMKILERHPNTFLSQATFAAGCFWGLELAFQRVSGVAYTAVGYTHGQQDDPSYEDVCSGETGHAEAVTLLYNPAEVSYDELLNVFWSRHDPTQLNGQGNDIGTQYRGGIYYHTEEQKAAAVISMAGLQDTLGKPLATELLASTKFWLSEDYHQQYLEKGGQSAKKTAVEKIRCYG